MSLGRARVRSTGGRYDGAVIDHLRLDVHDNVLADAPYWLLIWTASLENNRVDQIVPLPDVPGHRATVSGGAAGRVTGAVSPAHPLFDGLQ